MGITSSIIKKDKIKLFITNPPFHSLDYNESKLLTLNRYSMRKTIFFLLLGVLLAIDCRAQKDPSVVNSSGGSSTYKMVTYEWSVGEMAAIETNQTPSLIITQGFLQPLTSSGDFVDRLKSDTDKIKVYQGNGAQQCVVETSFECPGKLCFHLVDISGRVVLKEEVKIENGISEQSFNLMSFPNGIYLLDVRFISRIGTYTKTVKIQK